jgi:beta-lactamase regulating signal transducer with metallopeptidase domain
MAGAETLAALVMMGLRASNAVIDWLFTYAIHSTLLILGVWAVMATRPGRRLAPASAAWLWRFALVGGVLSATLQSIRSPDPLGGTMRLAASQRSKAVIRVEVDRTVTAPGDAPAQGAAVPRLRWRAAAGNVRATRVDVSPTWPLYLVGVWLLGAAGLAVLHVRARRRFFRTLADRRAGTYSLAGGALRGVLARTGPVRAIDLTISDRLTSPVALGGREICIPARALWELDPIRMESILAHELAHLERNDPAWLTLARWLEAVLYFQPLNRLARIRMQEAAEFASDSWAASLVSRPLDLAHCLARVAEWSLGSSRILAPAMAERRGATLVQRVRRLTDGDRAAYPRYARGLRVGAVASVLALVLVAPRVAVGAAPLDPGSQTGVFLVRLSGDSLRAGPANQVTQTRILRLVP